MGCGDCKDDRDYCCEDCSAADDTLAAHLYRVSAMDYAWDLVQTRYREWLGNKNGNAAQVVTKAMTAEWCGVPVEQVTIEDGEFRIALNPVSQWCCTVQEVGGDDQEQ